MGSHTWSGSGLQPWWAWDLQDLKPPFLPFSGPNHWGCPVLTWMLPTCDLSPSFLPLLRHSPSSSSDPSFGWFWVCWNLFFFPEKKSAHPFTHPWIFPHLFLFFLTTFLTHKRYFSPLFFGQCCLLQTNFGCIFLFDEPKLCCAIYFCSLSNNKH